MDKLNDVLKRLETNESASELEKISELIKVRLSFDAEAELFVFNELFTFHRAICNEVA
jgi:uncharacterized protein YdcH (DUF465 family)